VYLELVFDGICFQINYFHSVKANVMSLVSLNWIRQTSIMNTVANEQYPSIALDSSGNIYGTYYSQGTISGGAFLGATDIVVFKMDPNGNMLWIKQQSVINTIEFELYPQIAVDSSGNVYITYSTGGTVSGGIFLGVTDIVVFKMNTNGTILWIKQQTVMNTTGYDSFSSIDLDSLSNIYITYATYGTVSSGTYSGSSDIVVFKMNSSGTMQWIKQQTVMNSSGDEVYPSISVDSSGNVYVSYSTTGTVSGGQSKYGYGIVVFKMDTHGNIVWTKQNVLDYNYYNNFPLIKLDSFGNIYVVYISQTSSNSPSFIVVFKLDTNGNLAWIKNTQLITNAYNKSNMFTIDNFNNLFISYPYSGTISGGQNAGSIDIVVLKMDTNGNIVWISQQANMNSTGVDLLPSIAVDSSSASIYVSYMANGTVSSGTLIGGDDIVVAKLVHYYTPDAPTSVSALGGFQKAIVSFTAPVFDGGAAITGYTVTSSPSGIIATGLVSPITVTGLTNGVEYTFTVTATNIVGTGSASNPSNSIVPFQTPTINSVSLTFNSALISWSSNNGADSIKVYRDTQPSGATKTFLGSTTGLTYTEQLTASGTYYYFISAVYEGSETALSSPYMITFTVPAVFLSWIKQTGLINTSETEEVSSIATDSSGNVYGTYSTTGTVSGGTKAGSNDVVVFKMDRNGDIQWIKQQFLINTIVQDTYPTLAVDSIGNSYVAYYTKGTVSGGTKTGANTIVVYKLDRNGAIQWIRQQASMNSIGDTILDPYISPILSVDSSGTIYVSYFTYGTTSGGTNIGDADIVVFKMNTSGTLQWIKQQPIMNSPGTDANPSMSVDSSGNIYVSYDTTGTVSGGTKLGSSDIVIFKMDTNGNVQWIKQQAIMNTTDSDSDSSIRVDSVGNIYGYYQTNGTISGGTQLGGTNIVVFKMDPTGNLIWIKQQVGMAEKDKNPVSIGIDVSGNTYITYSTTGTVSGGTNVGNQDVVVFKMDTNGNMVWIIQQAVMNSSLSDTYPSLALDSSSGSIYVSYQTNGTVSGGLNVGSTDVVVMKLAQFVTPTISSISPSTYNNAWINVYWNTKNNADSINVYRDTQESGATKILVGSSTGTNYSDIVMTSGIYYYFISGVYGGIETAVSPAYMYTHVLPVYLSWIKQHPLMNTVNDDTNPSIGTDLSGNVYVSYSILGTLSSGTSAGAVDIVVSKLDPNGNIVWIKQQPVMNSASNDTGSSLQIDASGNIYVYYTTFGTVSGGTNIGTFDIVVFKMNPNGTVLWIKQQAVMNTYEPDISSKLAIDGSGNVYGIYTTSGGTVSGGTNVGGSDIVVFKMSSNGDTVWIKQQAVFNTYSVDLNPSIVADVSGNLYVSYDTLRLGSGGTDSGNSDIVLFKMDTNGTVQWVKQQPIMNTSGDNTFPSIDVDGLGNIYVSYETTGTVSGGVNVGMKDIVVFKTDPNGTMIWIQQQSVRNTSQDDQISSIRVDGQGNAFVVCSTHGTIANGLNSGGSDIVVFKLDTNGTVQWTRQEGIMNTSTDDTNPVIALDTSGNIYVSYQTLGTVSGGTNKGFADIVVMKMIQTGLSVPDAPTDISAVAGIRQASVSFTASSGYEFPVTNYTVISSPGNVTQTGTSSPININGLEPGTTYTFTVTATSAAGTSTPSVASNQVVIPNVPSQPAKPTAVAGNAQATVSFVPPSDGGSTITSYTINASPGDIKAYGSSSPIVVNGLNIGTAYRFEVSASNAVGTGPYSELSDSVTTFALPGQPTGVTAVRGVREATVSFVAPTSDGGTPITGYIVTSSSPGNPVRTAFGTASPITITELENNTAYTFTVSAVNEVGTGPASSPSASVTTATVPQQPTITSVAPGNREATVTFTAPTDNGGATITGYTVTSSSSVGIPIRTASGTGLSITVTNLEVNTAYTFTVTATNDVGTSAASESSDSITTFSLPNAPTIGAAVPGNQLAIVSFTAPTNTGGQGVVILEYTVTSYLNDVAGITATGTASPITIPNLQIGTFYTFTVSATNVVGTGPESAKSDAVQTYDLPDPPTDLSGVAGNRQVTVYFNPPVLDINDPPITGYTVISTPGNFIGTGTSSPITVQGLTPGTSYTFRAIATNEIGNSVPSAPSQPFVPFSAPDAPRNVSAVAGFQQVQVYFDPPANDGGDPITNYTVMYNPPGTDLNNQKSGSSSPITITNLQAGISYTFTVTATNSKGTGPASLPISATPYTIPDPPTNVNAVAGNQQVTVSFSAPLNTGGRPITNYIVAYTPGNIEISTTALSLTITNLQAGTLYTFTVAAVNIAGRSLPSVTPATATPYTIPAAPSVASVEPGNKQITVTITPPFNDGGSPITEYAVTYNPGAITLLFPTTTAVITGLQVGTGYTVTVAAINAAGRGPFSDTSSPPAIPYTTPDAPSIFLFEPGYNQAFIYFNPPLYDGGRPIVNYIVTYFPGNVEGTYAESPAVIPNLQSGVSYGFIVTAVNVGGRGEPSDLAGPVIPFSAPDAPVNVTAIPGILSANVFFEPPANDGTFAITDYTVISSPDNLVRNGAAAPILVEPLRDGIVYTFTVTATNSKGTGPASAPSSGIVPYTTPDAPTDLSGVAGNQQIEVLFTPPVYDGSSPITGYAITYYPDAITFLVSTSPFIIYNLEIGATYTFQVAAINAAGTGPLSEMSDPITTLSLPTVPRSVSAVPEGDRQVKVTFEPPLDNGGSPIIGYIVTHSSTLGIVEIDVGLVTTVYVSNLTPGIAYTFTVRAVNVAGTGPDSEPTSPVEPFTIPDPPTHVTAFAGVQQATVSFRPPSYNGGSPITGYTLTYNPGNVTIPVNSSPVIVTGLTVGTVYTFTITATNAAGTSAPSAVSWPPVTPFTIPDPPTDVTGVAGNRQVTVSFTPPVNDGGATITHYTVLSSPGNFIGYGSSSPITVIGLDINATYTFTVTATNVAGTSAPSRASDPVTTLPRSVTSGTNLAVFHLDQDGTNLWGYPRSESEAYPAYMLARTGAPNAVFETQPSGTFSGNLGIAKSLGNVYTGIITTAVAPGQTQVGIAGTTHMLCISALNQSVYYPDRNAFTYMTNNRSICRCEDKTNCGCS
jgi:predicted transcriptional regulator